MTERSGHFRIRVAFLWAAGLATLLTWLVFIFLDEHFDTTRPTRPDVASGRVIPHDDHGYIVYLTSGERNLLLALEDTSIGFALMATLAAYYVRKKERREEHNASS